MNTTIIALALVLFAGLINGSFAAPMKYMTRWSEGNTWLAFSISAFIILPWLTLLIMVPNIFEILHNIPPSVLFMIILGGIAFGLGQIAFVVGFQYIGIGLAFVINISMGTSGSALIPMLWHKGILGTTYSYVQFAGIAVFVLAVIFGAIAGATRDKNTSGVDTSAETGTKKIKSGMLMVGILLTVFAGIGSVAQGVTYIWSNPEISEMAMTEFGSAQLGSSIIVWVLIFSAAWIPYFIYFLFQNIKNRNIKNLFAKKSGRYWIMTILMAVGFWGSLVFFSMASNEMGGDLAPTVAWPLFMVFIILTSNFWSVKSGEWKGAGKKAGVQLSISLLLFIVAIVVFSYSSKLEIAADEEIKKTSVNHHFIHNLKTPREMKKQ